MRHLSRPQLACLCSINTRYRFDSSHSLTQAADLAAHSKPFMRAKSVAPMSRRAMQSRAYDTQVNSRECAKPIEDCYS